MALGGSADELDLAGDAFLTLFEGTIEVVRVSPLTRVARKHVFVEERAVLFMIIEHYRHGDPRPVYERFRKRGRLAPDGLRYINSWVTPDLAHCYQVMECEDRALLDQWITAWHDIVDFEIIPVITSAEAAARAPANA